MDAPYKIRAFFNGRHTLEYTLSNTEHSRKWILDNGKGTTFKVSGYRRDRKMNVPETLFDIQQCYLLVSSQSKNESLDPELFAAIYRTPIDTEIIRGISGSRWLDIVYSDNSIDFPKTYYKLFLQIGRVLKEEIFNEDRNDYMMEPKRFICENYIFNPSTSVWESTKLFQFELDGVYLDSDADIKDGIFIFEHENRRNKFDDCDDPVNILKGSPERNTKRDYTERMLYKYISTLNTI